jgi:polyisoprenoid-binding protein YceI
MAARRSWYSLIAAAAIVFAGAAASASRVADLDPTRSRALVEVGKAGALSFAAGHSHRIEAPIQGTLAVDPEHPEQAVARFEIRASDLTVMKDGEPPQDVPKVQETMAGERVLDVARYPTVSFQSRAIDVRHRRGGVLELTITGDLTLHGTTRSVSVPVLAEIAPDTITARGSFSVKQTDYGMTPVKVAGGMVAVKDEMKIRFTVVAPLASSNHSSR